MIYVSTRDRGIRADFRTATLEGLAPDGGLYVPQAVPRLDPDRIAALDPADAVGIARAVLETFAGDTLADATLQDIVQGAFARFAHPAVAPLVEIAPRRWVLELFHGPTLAFKDHAMQLLGPLLGHFLAETGRSAMVLCATSGDTGGAALAAIQGLDRLRALILYPKGGVSAFQEAQMHTLSGPSHRVLAVNGSFDDCQRLVKAALGDPTLSGAHGLTAMNSVNWARIAAQTVYYAHAALRLGRDGAAVDFAVPTGNFGNAYAGHVARRIGFPVGRILVAVNANDALHRIATTGRISAAPVIATQTPAMDIQVPSNFERMLFDLASEAGKGAGDVRAYLAGVALPPGMLSRLRDVMDFSRVPDAAVIARMKAVFESTGYIVDPHTALGLEASLSVDSGGRHHVTIATAHPAKFAETVEAALDVSPPLAHGRRPVFHGAMRTIDATPGSVRSEIESLSTA